MKHAFRSILIYAFLALFTCAVARAQASTEASKPSEAHKEGTVDYVNRLDGDFVVRTYHLANAQTQNDANEELIALRNILSPYVHIYLVASTNMIVIAAPLQQHQIAQSILEKLDIPRMSYRLTYTLTELENNKRIGTQHYTLIAAEGQRVTLKQGSKVPVLTGSGGAQFQYIDVGMNFSAEASPASNGIFLRTKVEQSSVPEDKTISSGVNEPVIRQAMLEGASFVTFGKPLILGSMDVLGSSRHIEIEVVAEPINQPNRSR